MKNELGFIEGEKCNRNGCIGIMQDNRDPDWGCSCHLNPPCGYCTSDEYICDTCGFNVAEDEYEPQIIKKKIVVLSGAGVSAESGVKTFRDSDGLWENYRIQDVATLSGFERDPELVLDFYNQRRRQLKEVEPNDAHEIIAELEKDFDVVVITQNVDNLHERAGSSKIIHLHGELNKVRPIDRMTPIWDWDVDLEIGMTNDEGVQLRPHIVWFGESVPMMSEAAKIVGEADICVVIGTSMQVYPAAQLINFTKEDCKIYVINPERYDDQPSWMEHIQEKATEGMKILKNKLLK